MRSPEEKLNLLFELLLKRRLSEALSFFQKNASPPHVARFEIALVGVDSIRMISHYIFLISELPMKTAFVIGLDDNYRFFCHNLVSSKVSSEEELRDVMGFDVHWWEVDEHSLYEGIRIRMQGDLVISIIKILEGELDKALYSYLVWEMLSQLLRITNKELYEALREVILDNWGCDGRLIKAIETFLNEKLRDNISSKFYFNGLAKALFGLSMESIDRIFKFLAQYVHLKAKRTLNMLLQEEKSITFLLGRHRIKMIGVNGRDVFMSLWNLRLENMASTVYLLRKQLVVFYHPEHKTTDIELPPCIIRLDTLRSGVLGRVLILPSAIAQHILSIPSKMMTIYLAVIGIRDEDRLAISWPYSEGRVGVAPATLKNVFILKDAFYMGDEWIKVRFVIQDFKPDSIDEYYVSRADAILLVSSDQDELLSLAEAVSKTGSKVNVMHILLDYGNNIINIRDELIRKNTLVLDPFDSMTRRALFRKIAQDIWKSQGRHNHSK